MIEYDTIIYDNNGHELDHIIIRIHRKDTVKDSLYEYTELVTDELISKQFVAAKYGGDYSIVRRKYD